MSQEQLVAAAYGAVLVFVLIYVVIIAAKLARLQRETAAIAEQALRARELSAKAHGAEES